MTGPVPPILVKPTGGRRRLLDVTFTSVGRESYPKVAGAVDLDEVAMAQEFQRDQGLASR